MLDSAPPAALVADDELERLRIEARTPRWGSEIDDRVLPAEAGLNETHVSFAPKGCYPGQEPIARLHYRGKANRGLRVLNVEGTPAPETEVFDGEKVVGRVTARSLAARSHTCGPTFRRTPNSRCPSTFSVRIRFCRCLMWATRPGLSSPPSSAALDPNTRRVLATLAVLGRAPVAAATLGELSGAGDVRSALEQLDRVV